MLVDLLQPTRYHDRFVALKHNLYHDKTGAFTTKEKAAPPGPAQLLANQHVRTLSAADILKKALPSDEREAFEEVSRRTTKEHDSGRSSKKEHTKPGTNSYTAARLQLHRTIIAKLFGDRTHALPAPGEKPKVILIGGRSGSGKGNFLAGKGSESMTVYDEKTAIVLDPDKIKAMLPGYDPVHATLFHQESADIFDKAIALARKRGLNTVLDFTMSHDKTPLVKSFKKQGFAVEAHYVHRPPEKAAIFAIRRYQMPTTVKQLDGSKKTFAHGRIVPVDVVLKQTENERYFDKIRQHVDRWSLYDNSQEQHDPKLVASSDGRHLAVKWYKDVLGRFTSKAKAVFGGGQHKPSAPAEKFTKDVRQEGRVLNGVEMRVDDDPDFSQSVNREIGEPPLVPVPGKKIAAGVIVTEPDGRVWLVQPKDFYGGYKNTFPKGTVKPGEDLQETAAREVWEESGLVVKITGHLVDVERGYSKTRFYRGQRIGGAPWMAGRESHAVKLVPIEGKETNRALQNVMNRPTTDQQVIDALRKKTRVQKTGNPYHDEDGKFTTREGVYFHGMAEEQLERIASEGLHPRPGSGWKEVFLTSNPKFARSHAQFGHKKPVVIEVHIPPDQQAQAKPSLSVGSVTFPDRIPVEWIKKVYEVGPEGWIERVKKSNPYKDAQGLFTTKERAVKPGWYKSHGGHHVEVGASGTIVSGTHAGKTAESKHFAAGPFASHAEAKAHGLKPVSKPAKQTSVQPSATSGDLPARSVRIEALLKSGTAPKHAILQVSQDAQANASKVKALGSGPALDRAVKEYSETPTQDLDVLTGIEVQNTAVGGQAHCTWGRKVVMGSSSVTGDFRHELGHAIHMSLSPALQDHVIALHAEAMAKWHKFPAKSALKPDLSHEFYEKTYGVIGKRSLDNWHEDFAEHYRAYVKARHQVRHGKNPKALDTYTDRHPKWSKFWDAYYAGGAS